MRAGNAEVFDVMIVIDKCWTDEAGDVVDYKTLEHEVLGSYETEPEAAAFIASLTAPPAVDVDTTVKLNTLDTIARLLDGQEWDSSTTSAISEALTAAGYIIREPLLASDFGELEPGKGEA